VALVKQYGKVFGYFDGLLPNLWITDADMIKAICVKDFEHFVDRRVRLFFCIAQLLSLITLNYFSAVFWYPNKSYAQMDDADEGARVERHSLFSYAGLHNRQNQTSNLVLKTK
jgi:hypothetical protein